MGQKHNHISKAELGSKLLFFTKHHNLVVSETNICQIGNFVALPEDFLSYIFSVSENTEIIHLIKMIWLFSFIISSFKLASGPPNDPGGSKEDIFKIKEMIHRIFSVKTNIEPVPK